MIWHIVTFDMSAIDEPTRAEVERDIERLRALDVVAWLAVAHDVDVPQTTGLITMFRSYDDLETYRTHPEHVPLVQRIKDLGVAISRLDVEAPIPPTDLATP